MTLESASAIAQIIGSAAVIASLIFVGIQIRQSSATTRAHAHQQLSDTFTAYLGTLANHASIVTAGANSKSGLGGMTDEDLVRFSFLMAGLFKIWENAFYQNASGFLDERSWQSNVKWMRTWHNMPGVQTWWAIRKDLFATEFQAFVEALPPPDDGRTISERLRAAAQAGGIGAPPTINQTD